MELSRYNAPMYRKEADRLHPEGCQCTNDSGVCEWCEVYYEGPPEEAKCESQ